MTLFSVARPMAFKVPQARALPTPFALTVVIALSLTSATGGLSSGSRMRTQRI
jgi:hypothetical protein